MRVPKGVRDGDMVTDRRVNKTAQACDVHKVGISLQQQETETAKAELAKLKAKLGLHGIDIDSLPDVLPGAEPVEEADTKAPETGKKAKEEKEKPAEKEKAKI